MPPPDLKWLEIRDFRPGIQQCISGHDAQALPLGSATDETYGCCSSPSGALVPLPAPQDAYSPTPPDNFANVKDNRYYISGFHVAGPISGAASASGNQNEFHIAWEWYKTTAPNPHREYRWERHQIFANPVVVDTLRSETGGASPTADAVRGTFFDDVRMDNADPLNPGRPLVAAAWYEEGGGGDKFVAVYPDTAAPTTNGIKLISTALPCDIIAAHQGRLIMFEQRGWSHGSPGSWISNEQIWFTNINLPTIEPTVAQTFSTDRMTGIGAAKGVSANEFLMVKFQGGAYTVSGDFSNPTVIRLPGVAPTYGATIIPVYTAMGLVYAALGGGVYAWSGGSSAQHLSDVLCDGFWEIADLGKWINYHGKFELWRDWVVVPNSWLYDTRTGGWWRLENKTVTRQFFHYGVDYTGALYAVWDQKNQGDGAIVKSFGWGTLRNSYFWVSNYLPNIAGPGRGITVREVVVEAVGAGNVTIILESGGTETGDDPTVFQPNSTVPFIIRRSASKKLNGNVSLEMTCEGNGGAEAPSILSIKLGYYEDTPVNRT